MARYSNPATRKGTPFRVLRVQGAGRWERPESQKVIWIPSPNSQNYQDQIMALSSSRMKIHIFKIDVDDGVDPQDRCRWGFGCQKSMSVRVWIPKINVREGLGPQDRCRGWFEFPKSMAKRAHNFSEAQSQCTRWHLVHWFWLYLVVLIWEKVAPQSEKYHIFDIDFDLGAQHKNQCTRSHLVHWKPMVLRVEHWFDVRCTKIRSMPRLPNHRFSMYQMRSGALIFMLSPQVKVNVEDRYLSACGATFSQIRTTKYPEHRILITINIFDQKIIDFDKIGLLWLFWKVPLW